MLKRFLPLLLVLASLTQCLRAQHPAEIIVQSILQNNTNLKAGADKVRASQAENLTGLTLADPEVEVSYYWGSPHAIGNRTDLSVTQHFDYATLFGLKRKLAKSRNEALDIEQQILQLTLEGEVRQILVELTYLNQQQVMLADRISTAKALYDNYQKAIQKGSVTRLERDKAQLALLALQAERDELTISQNQATDRLTAFNAGQPIAYTSTEYPPVPAEYNSRSLLKESTTHLLDSQAKIIEQEEQSARAASLPELTAGYASELTAGEKFRGITIGLSVPLWSHRGAVRAAKSKQLAHRSQAEDALLQLQQQRQSLRQSMDAHRCLADRLNKAFSESTTLSFLRRALDLGEISLLDYLQELTLLYDLQDKALQAEHEYQQARTAWLLIGE